MALSLNYTGKYTSENHQNAIDSGKLTAGETAKIVGKAVGLKLTVKSLNYLFCEMFGRTPEWHHSGFYGKNMGRTYFYKQDEIQLMITNFDLYRGKVETFAKSKELLKAKELEQVQGFYFHWESDYQGQYGRKRNYKVLGWYQGIARNKPNNFTACDIDYYATNCHIRKNYYGWNEPTLENILEIN